MLTCLALLAGCSGKDSVEGMNEGYGLTFSIPGGQLTFFQMSDGHLIRTDAMGEWTVARAAINVQGSYLIVADGSRSRIGVISLPELTELTSVPLGGVPTDLQISATGDRAYVITQNSNFWVYAVASGHADTLEIGDAPRRLTLRPTSVQVWIACAGDSTVRVVELQGPRTLDTLRFGYQPTAVAFSPDGGRAYVALAGTPGAIIVLNASTYEVEEELAAGSGPFELAVSSDGHFLAAADSVGHRTRVWNLDSYEYWNIEVGGMAGRIRFSREAHAFFVCSNQLNEVLKIDISTGVPVLTDTISIVPDLRELVLWESL